MATLGNAKAGRNENKTKLAVRTTAWILFINFGDSKYVFILVIKTLINKVIKTLNTAPSLVPSYHKAFKITRPKNYLFRPSDEGENLASPTQITLVE